MTDEPATSPHTGSLMRGKRGLVMGIANDRSIAWGIAAACASQGADLAFTFQGEALERRVRPLAESVGSGLVFPCDVSDGPSIDAAFAALGRHWDRLDFVVHAIGFADKAYLRGRYLDTPREVFLQALDISAFSFTAVCQRAVPMMGPGGSLLTLSYLGAERVVPHYNVMGIAKAALEASVRYLAADLGGDGIRVNAISAGPIKTLAASGIGDFPLHSALEPAERADGAQRHGSGRRRSRAVSAVGSRLRRHRRGASRGLRVSHCRHEKPGCPGYRDRDR